MKLGLSGISMFAAAFAVLSGPDPASAIEHPVTSAARLLAPKVERSGAVAGARRDVRRQREIYRILCGGAADLELGVSEHLWRVAESLAVSEWQPPKVTVRVVVSDLPPAG